MNATWTTILVGGAATFAMRASFLAFAHRMSNIPAWVARLLRQIPPAALASIVIPAFVRPEGVIALNQPRLWAGLIAAAVAFTTRNVVATLVVGMAAVMLFSL